MLQQILDQIKIENVNKSLINIIEYMSQHNVKIVEFDKENKKIVLEAEGMNLTISTNDNEVIYEGALLSEKIKVTHTKNKNGYHVKETRSQSKVTESLGGDFLSSLYHEEISVYNNEGELKYKKRIFETEDKLKTEVVEILRAPGMLRNIKETEYTWKLENNDSIKRKIIKNKYPEDIKNQYNLEDTDKCFYVLQEEGTEKEISKNEFFKFFKEEGAIYIKKKVKRRG